MNGSFVLGRLSDLAVRIDYGVTASASAVANGPKFLRITDIQDGVVDWQSVPFCVASPNKLESARLANGDIVFARTGATTGKSFLIQSPPDGAVFASYLIRVRPSASVVPGYLAHFFQSDRYWSQIRLKTQGAAQGGVNASSLSEIEIPLPPLDEQRRIAAILDKADAVRRKRKRVIELLDGLTCSIFLQQFGDPNSNPRGLQVRSLSEVATFASGGTPSKDIREFWTGDIPWVSPKDMKVVEIIDAEDHINENALTRTSLKLIESEAILLVVRGMILAHTIPIAIARRAIAINQDMKAIRFGGVVSPEFGLWCLKSQAGYILSKVSTAAHGTKRLETSDVAKLRILVPDGAEQRKFVQAASAVRAMIRFSKVAFEKENSLFLSLQNLAFSGEL